MDLVGLVPGNLTDCGLLKYVRKDPFSLETAIPYAAYTSMDVCDDMRVTKDNFDGDCRCATCLGSAFIHLPGGTP
jgi:hypothetical protein